MSQFARNVSDRRRVLTGAIDILFGLLPTALVYIPRLLPLFLGTSASILFLLLNDQEANHSDLSLLNELASYWGYSIAGLFSLIGLWLAVVANYAQFRILRAHRYLLSFSLSMGIVMDIVFFGLFNLFRASFDATSVSTYKVAIAAHSLVSLRYLYLLILSRMGAAA